MEQQGDKITDRDLAAGMLKRILSHRALLTITMPGSNKIYNSAILEINQEQGTLLLDELNPKGGHDQLLETKKLHARAMVKGTDISFNTILEEANIEDGISIYQVRFPDVVWHYQKRQDFRITLEPGIHIPVHLGLESGKRIQGELIDISKTGIRFYMKTYMELEVGAILPNCQINLPDKTKIISKFEIRFKEYDKDDNKLIIGGRFIDLPRPEQKLLARKVAIMQRDMIKRLPREQL
jgi:c-di-GMP-binding flagellar brake protein YcgR